MKTQDLKPHFDWLIAKLQPTNIELTTRRIKIDRDTNQRLTVYNVRCQVNANEGYMKRNGIMVMVANGFVNIMGDNFSYTFPNHQVLTIKKRLKIK